MEAYDWQSRIARAFTQRIHLMPEMCCMKSAHEFFFKVMGNTANAYDVIINENEIWCSCPDCDSRGNFCKHLMFVLIRVVGMQADEVFRNNFQPTTRCYEQLRAYFEHKEQVAASVALQPDSSRKPIEPDDDCPICYETLVGEEATVWCKSGCGKSVHLSCFQKWSMAKRSSADCVYCRAKWIW